MTDWLDHSPTAAAAAVQRVRKRAAQAAGRGLCLLVEQSAMLTFETTTGCLVLENGEIALSCAAAELSCNSRVRSIHIGV